MAALAVAGVCATAAGGAQPGLDEAAIVRRARVDEARRVAVIARVAPAVVSMLDERGRGRGAGVIIDEAGYGLTNFHVVARMMEKRRGRAGLPDGKTYSLRVLGVDVTGDVAMFKLSGDGPFPAAALGDSDALAQGDGVLVMGNPFGLAHDHTPSVSMGIVSGLHRYQHGAGGKRLVYTDCIQSDAAINPGNSGGPMFNMQGEVVGIVGRASFEERGRVSVGLGYAISSNQIRRFIPGLRAGRLTHHGTLDATVTDRPGRGVVFDAIDERSAAARAGIRLGDVLVGFAGRKIDTANQFANILGIYPEGWPVEVRYRRDGQAYTARLRLGRLPVELENPIATDREQNLTETRRALDAFAAAIGGRDEAAAVTRIGWRASRLAGGSPEAIEVTQAVAQSPLEAAPGEPANVLAWGLLEPISDETQARWSFVGADEHEHELVEVIERLSPAGARVRLALSPTTHLLRRVQVIGDDGHVAREYSYHDYRDADGVRLPYWMSYTGKQAGERIVEVVSEYTVTREH